MAKIKRCVVCRLRKLDAKIDLMKEQNKTYKEIIEYVNKQHKNYLKKENKTQITKSQISQCFNHHQPFEDVEQIKQMKNLQQEELEEIKERVKKEIEENKLIENIIFDQRVLNINVNNELLKQQQENKEVGDALIKMQNNTTKNLKDLIFLQQKINTNKLEDVNVEINLKAIEEKIKQAQENTQMKAHLNDYFLNIEDVEMEQGNE